MVSLKPADWAYYSCSKDENSDRTHDDEWHNETIAFLEKRGQARATEFELSLSLMRCKGADPLAGPSFTQ